MGIFRFFFFLTGDEEQEPIPNALDIASQAVAKGLIKVGTGGLELTASATTIEDLDGGLDFVGVGKSQPHWHHRWLAMNLQFSTFMTSPVICKP